MILIDALNKGTAILKLSNIEAPVIEAGVMLCHLLKVDRTYLYTYSDRVLDEDIINEYFRLLELRCNKLPLQYITGHQEFMSLDFVVTKDVLIPRQDTEILVETVVDFVKYTYPQILSEVENAKCEAKAIPIDILDIGTGSGCISVSLAYYIKNSFVTALDISEAALEIARINSQKNGMSNRVEFIRSDLFEKVEGRIFDIIVSNPPYIPAGDIKELQREVKEYEPITALDGGNDGLFFYRKIIRDAIKHLKPDGLLAFEIGYNQAESLVELLNADYYDIKIIKDLSQNNRVVIGKLKNFR